MIGDHDTKGEAGYQGCSLPKSLLFRKCANTCSWRAHFFYLFTRKEWLIQPLAIINRHWACDSRVRSQQRTDCTPCKGIKIMDISPARRLRQIWEAEAAMLRRLRTRWQPASCLGSARLRRAPKPRPASSDTSPQSLLPIRLTGLWFALNPYPTPDPQSFSSVTGIFFFFFCEKKLSLGRRNPKNYLLSFKCNNKTTSITRSRKIKLSR